ncbi:MAG: outer membrane beta-barrel protein [Verrucomicrobiales bacterium]|jgi:opacity protein-like surface antigen|nr:outer membrane beta-barrel protein [Verrucomicrobiales bacterium]
MKTAIHRILLAMGSFVLLGITGNLMAQQPPEVGSAYRNGGSYPYMAKNNDPAPIPAFQTSVKPRTEYGTENYVAVWGGANLFQDAGPRIKDNLGLGIKADLSLKDSTDFAVGLKIGHIWKPDSITISGEKSPVTFLPSVEGEFIYTQNSNSSLGWNGSVWYGNTNNTATADLTQKFSMNIYALTANPIMRIQWSIFRPYIGFGIGGAYVEGKLKTLSGNASINSADYPEYNGNYSGSTDLLNASEDQFAFCFQGIAGTDIFLDDRWSIFAEYKYLGLVGLEFNKALAGYATYDFGDVYGNHLVVAGIKFHY